MYWESTLSFTKIIGRGLMLLGIAATVLMSSLPMSQVLDHDFDLIELADMEEEAEEKKESEEKEQNEKFHQYAEDGKHSKSSRDVQIYLKEHLISEESQEINTPPPERS